MAIKIKGFPLMDFLFKNFLNRMAICFILCLVVMTIITIMKPLREPMQFELKTSIDVKSSKGAAIAGVFVILLTISLYILFSPLVLAK
jgi:SSS family solute:Na+ symporter